MRNLAALPMILLALTACPPGNEDDTSNVDDTGEGNTELTFEDFIDVTEPIIVKADDGDITCWNAGDDWIAQTPDTSLQAIASTTGKVLDFQEDEKVVGAAVQIFNNDDPNGSPDSIGVTDQNGDVTVDVPTCQPSAYRVSTEDGDTKVTFEVHQMYEPDGGSGVSSEFNSVSRVTYNIIPALLGISPDADKSIIAGTAFDCNEEPIEGAQVVVKVDGEIPQSLIVKYFVDDFPNRDQPHTSADGLWVAVNVPTGDATVELWGIPVGGTDLTMLASTSLPTVADSINISNMHWGFDSGIKYPESCLATPE